MRVLGGVTAASQLAAAIVLVVGSPLVGRVGGDSAHAGNGLVRTVQDSTVVCTVPELHGRSDFHIYYTRNFTGLSTPPASLDVLNGKTGLAWDPVRDIPEPAEGRLRRSKAMSPRERLCAFEPRGAPRAAGPAARLHVPCAWATTHPRPRRLESPRVCRIDRRSLVRDTQAGRAWLPQPDRGRRPVHEPRMRS